MVGSSLDIDAFFLGVINGTYDASKALPDDILRKIGKMASGNRPDAMQGLLRLISEGTDKADGGRNLVQRFMSQLDEDVTVDFFAKLNKLPDAASMQGVVHLADTHNLLETSVDIVRNFNPDISQKSLEILREIRPSGIVGGIPVPLTDKAAKFIPEAMRRLATDPKIGLDEATKRLINLRDAMFRHTLHDVTGTLELFDSMKDITGFERWFRNVGTLVVTEGEDGVDVVTGMRSARNKLKGLYGEALYSRDHVGIDKIRSIGNIDEDSLDAIDLILIDGKHVEVKKPHSYRYSEIR